MSHTVRFKLSSTEARKALHIVNNIPNMDIEKFAKSCMIRIVNGIYAQVEEVAAREQSESGETVTGDTNNGAPISQTEQGSGTDDTTGNV